MSTVIHNKDGVPGKDRLSRARRVSKNERTSWRRTNELDIQLVGRTHITHPHTHTYLYTCSEHQAIPLTGSIKSEKGMSSSEGEFDAPCAGTLTLFGALKVYKQTVAAWGPGGMGFGWGGVPVGFVLHRCCSIVGKQCPQIV